MLSRFLAIAGLVGTLWTIGGCLTAADKSGDVDRDVAALAARLSPSELSIVKTNEFQGFSRLVVKFRGHEAWIVSPKAPAPGRKWVWCMKWPGAFAQFTGQVNALERGYYYVFLDDSQWMNPEGTKRAKAWRDLLVNELGFKKKTHLIGMSWGGFFSTRYASTYPEDVENIYLDCPVLGFHDFQFHNYSGDNPCWSMDPKHDWYNDPLMPVNRAEIIAKAGIPILLIYGGKDVTVPPKGNCELFLPRFKAAGGIAEVYCRPDWKHHPHGFTEKADRGRVIDFFESPARKSSFTVISDVVIYGSSPAAFSAAIQARRMNRSATIVSPETRIGGLTTGGLGMTDIGNKKAFGGLALDFYKDVRKFYSKDENWTRMKRTEYGSHEQSDQKSAESMWTFEPSAALKILEGWEKTHALSIHRGKLLDRAEGQVKVENVAGGGRRIVSFKTLDGTVYVGKMFVDATYEGDLMAAAGVSYHVGREANSVYGEKLSGLNRAEAKYHQFQPGVSGYVVEGDPSSGLLPYLEKETDDPDGTGDKRVQAYCFRMCLTDVPENRIPFKKPANYEEKNYELLFRNFAQQEKLHPELIGKVGAWQSVPWINSKMPNRKTDTNNRLGFSTDFIGQNWKWAEASYAEREQILKAHLDYQQGLMWTLANHPRIPVYIRKEVSRWGTCKDEFADGLGDGWQKQLYVREARRMVGDYVMTEKNCRHEVVAPRPVAMAAYQMDSHNVRRYVDKNGFARNEGDVEVGCPGPYPIDYGALIPKKAECTNLFVPVCVSSSHMAFGSIRMEPVFFALGQAAGTAAVQAIEAGCAVQDLPYEPLAKRLRADGQVLEFTKP